MEDFIEVHFVASEIDLDYEFDAARFFDFTRPESISETDEAERWFESAGSYPPSPFIVKLNWSTDIAVLEAAGYPNSDGGEHMNSINNNSEVASLRETENGGMDYQTDIAPDIMKAKTKSLAKSSKLKSSTLMKPTASHLAKQSKVRDANSKQVCRSHKPLTKVNERSLHILPGFEREATKRQKLESGYLRKVAHLKHQTLLLHKLAKKVGPVDTNSLHSRAKVTIPREPDLETALRAQRRSSKNASESGQQENLNCHTFKARPLNRKILEAPSLAPPRKSKPQLPVFQVFQLKTMERAMQHSSASVLSANDLDSVLSSEDTDFKGPNFEGVIKQNYETLDKLKACSLNKKLISSKKDTGAVRNIKQKPTDQTELKGPTEKQLFSENPPIELFNKLSLKSEFENNTVSHSKPHISMKGSKENAPSSFQLEFQRCVGKSNKCGSIRRIPEFAHGPNMNRSLDIR